MIRKSILLLISSIIILLIILLPKTKIEINIINQGSSTVKAQPFDLQEYEVYFPEQKEVKSNPNCTVLNHLSSFSIENDINEKYRLGYRLKGFVVSSGTSQTETVFNNSNTSYNSGGYISILCIDD